MPQNRKTKLPFYLLIGLVSFQVIILAATMLAGRGRQAGNGGRGDGSFFPFWLVILIPILTARKRKKGEGTNQQKILWLSVGLAFLVLLGMLVFLFKIWS